MKKELDKEFYKEKRRKFFLKLDWRWSKMEKNFGKIFISDEAIRGVFLRWVYQDDFRQGSFTLGIDILSSLYDEFSKEQRSIENKGGD